MISVDGLEYIVGDNVYKLGRKPITANENVRRAENIAYKVLAMYALAKTSQKSSETVSMVTGLPFQNMDEAELLKTVFEKTHELKLNGKDMNITVKDVFVVSQGLGSFYSLVRQRGNVIFRKKILLVDLGFRTVNYLPLNNGDIDADTVKTNRDLGIQAAYKRITDAVNLEFKSNFKYYEVDDLLDKGVPQQDKNSGIVYEPIIDRPYVKDALRMYARDVWTDILDKYDDRYRESLEEVVFSGGTAERVRDFLEEEKQHFCSIVEDSQDVQVLGYEEIAQQLELEESK